MILVIRTIPTDPNAQPKVRPLGTTSVDWQDILAKIEGGEGNHTEIRSRLDLSAVGKTICSFANTGGGVVILGVTDGCEIMGIDENPEIVQEKLTSLLDSCCGSPVSATLGRHKVLKGWVHWIKVPRQRGLEPFLYDGRVWVRRGRSSVEPSPAELQELYNMFGYILTEGQTIQAAAAPDVDIEVFDEYLRRQEMDTETDPQPSETDDLRNRGVLDDSTGKPRLTLYGALAFGSDPQAYPQTRNFVIDCVAYRGDDQASKPLLVDKAAGRIGEQVERSVRWFTSLGRFESYRGLILEDRHLLPLEALRESLVNAVVHRDYSITGSKILLEVFEGRVDITSPGGLPNHMSAESVMAGGRLRSRNESMAHYMATMGFMEQRGRGGPIMRHAMARFNGTKPEISQGNDGAFVRVRFHLKPA